MKRRIFCKVLLVIVAVFGLLVLSSILSAQGRSENAFERVREVQERNTDRLMEILDVEGTAVGLDENDQFVVKVYTARPGITGIPANLEKVPVQVEVTGKFVARTTGRYRPAPIGVSTGHPDITAGTIGCRVTDGPNVYALSNNHVYANENLASIDDNVLQPGAFDGGVDPDDAIGTLYAFEPIVFHTRANNTIDAAIALCSEATLGNATPSDGYGTPNSTIVGAVLGQQVQKYGRTTGRTYGEVTGINATVRVGYSRGVARFVGQIIIGPGGFSEGGDSGSLIVTNDESCNPVGLLFAGSSTMTVANPIDAVLGAFGVEIDDTPSDGGTTNTPPTAGFTYTTSDLKVDLKDLSTDSDGTIVSWSWAFGDDATSTKQNPSHTYAADGTYTVSLTVTDNAGAIDSTSQSVTVSSSGGGFTLSAVGYKVKGRHNIDLTWSGATSTNVAVAVYRDDELIVTTGNDGAYTDATNNVGGGSYTYHVCEADTTTCSNEVTVTF